MTAIDLLLIQSRAGCSYLIRIASAVGNSVGGRSEKPISIVDESGNLSAHKTISDKPALTAAFDQSAFEKAPQVVRNVGLSETRSTDNFLHGAFPSHKSIED